MEHPTGSLKHDPVSGSVAIRTSFPEVGDLSNHAWLVATTGSGALSKTSADVEAWADLALPEQPAEPEPAPSA